MWNLLKRWTGFRSLDRAKTEHRRRAARRRAELFPSLQVRSLEERRVFHAGAVAAPVAGTVAQQPPPPPPPAMTLSLDANQSLVIESAGGSTQSDALLIRFDQATNQFEISSGTGILQSDIAGVTGSGTATLFISAADFAGESLVVQTGEGNDSLTVDASFSQSGKSIAFHGGAGTDNFTVVGSAASDVNYSFFSAGLTQLQVIGSGATGDLQFEAVENVNDFLSATNRSFVIGAGIDSAVLSGAAGSSTLGLTVSGGPNVAFQAPTAALLLNGSAATHFQVTGSLDLSGADLRVQSGTIDLTGSIRSDDAQIELRAEQLLTVAATGTINNAGGQVTLDAGEMGTLVFSGRLDVSDDANGQVGGSATLLGKRIDVLGPAVIDAMGDAGGGTVLIGQDATRGRVAENLLLEQSVTVDASAMGDGNGGTIMVFASKTALIDGSEGLRARGGLLGGNGGFIETSGLEYLRIRGAPDASALFGIAGNWLIDPHDVRIIAGGPENVNGSGVFTSSSGNTDIDPATIAAALANQNVTINTGNGGGGNGDIFIEDAIAANIVGTHTLTLNAHRDIIFNDSISATTGVLNVVLNAGRSVVFVSGTVSARQVTIDAATNVTSGSATSDIILVGIGSNATIDAVNIGVGGQSLTINAGSVGTVDLIATTDIDVEFSGDFSTDRLSLNVSGSGRQIALSSSTGSILIDTTDFAANTANDHFTFATPAGGVSFDDGTLTAASVTIDALTTVTRSGAATNDIDTSAVNGAVSIAADGGIGSSVEPLRIRAGSGLVEATTVTGSIWITSPDIRLGEIQTGNGQQTVSIVGTNSLQIVASSTTNDDWRLTSGGNITLVGSVTLEASVFSNVQAGGNLVSGSAAIDFKQTGLLSQMVLDADALGTLVNPIRVDLGLSGAMDLTASVGDLCVVLVEGDLNSSRLVNNTITTPASGATVFLTAANGSISLGLFSFLANVAPANALRLEAYGAIGNINLGPGTAEFSSVTLTADGAITSTNLFLAIDTSAANGAITLRSDDQIGLDSLLPLMVRAGTGTVSAVTTGALGNIYLGSSEAMRLGNIDAENALAQEIFVEVTSGGIQLQTDWNTEDNLTLIAVDDITFLANIGLTGATVSLRSSNGDIVGSGSATADVTVAGAGALISLDAVGVGSALTPFLIDPASGDVSLRTADAYVRIRTGSFNFNRFDVLDMYGSNGTFDFGTLNGSLTIDETFISLGNDHVVLTAEGTNANISIATGSLLAGQSLNLDATGAIQGGGNIADLQSASSVVLSAPLGIGASGTPLGINLTSPTGFVRATTTTGDIYLQSPGTIRLDTVTTGNGNEDVNVQAAGGIDLLANSDFNDTWVLGSTAGSLRFEGTTVITAVSFNADVAGSITQAGTGTAIDTSDADGNITLRSGGPIGTNTVLPLVVRAGTGTVSAVTTGLLGNIYLTSPDSLRLGNFDAENALAQDIFVESTSGEILLLADWNTEDRLTLTAVDNITFQTGIGLTGSTVSLRSTGGNIVGSGSATADVTAVGAGATISLDAAEVGSVATPFLIDPASGDVSLRATDAYVRILTGSFAFDRFDLLDITGSNGTFNFGTLNGSLTINDTFASLNDDNIVLTAAGTNANISVAAGSQLIGQSLDLNATGAIQGGGNLADLESASSIVLSADLGIGSSGTPLSINLTSPTGFVRTTTTTGDIYLQSAGRIRLDTVTTGNGNEDVNIQAAGGIDLLASSNFGDSWNLGSTAGDLRFLGTTAITAAAFNADVAGSITQAGAGTSINTSAANGNLTLRSGGPIGTSTVSPLVVRAGMGTVSAVTTGALGNIYLSSPEALRLGNIDAEDVGIQDISVRTTAGGMELQADWNTEDSLLLTAVNNITFLTGTNLAGNTVTLTSTAGSIVGGGSATPDVTSNTIILSGSLGIGASGTPLAIDITSPTGFVRAATTTGDIYLQSAGRIRLDTVTTGNGNEVVNIQAAGGIDLLASSNFNDSWELGSSAGDLHFLGTTVITAASFTADVTGPIIQAGTGTVINTSAAGGAVSLTGSSIGGSLQPIVLNPGTGNLSFHAEVGDIWLVIAGGDVVGARIANLQADGTNVIVQLTAQNGSINLNNLNYFQVADDRVTLRALGAGHNIDFSGNGGALTAAEVTLNANGSILSNGAAAMDVVATQAGASLTLTAGDNIGSSNDPLLIRVPQGTVTATASTGSIFLQSDQSLTIEDAVAAEAGRQLSFATTGTGSVLNVLVNSLGGDGDQWRLRSSSDLTLRITDPSGISFNQIPELSSTAANASILVEAVNGPINLATLGPGIVTANDQVTLRAGGGDIIAPTMGVLQGSTLTLEAPVGQIGDGGNALRFTAGQLSTISAGPQWLTTAATTRVTSAQTTLFGAGITFAGGSYFLDPAVPSGTVVVTNQGILVLGANTLLGGDGRVVGSLRVLQDGVVNMGASLGATGRLLVDGDVFLDRGARLVIDINSPYAQPGIDYDQLVVGGNLLMDEPILELNGATDLTTSLGDIVLVNVLSAIPPDPIGFSPNAGSLFESNGVQRVQVGSFRGNLIYNGGNGNDITLSQLSFTPPNLRLSAPQPTPRIPILTRIDTPLPIPVVPPQVATAVVEMPVEPEEVAVSTRFIEVRVVIPIDEAGNVREEFAFKLPAEWLADLPAVLRRLPDDRYRLYLMLEGGNEQRLIIDALVRGGRPVESASDAETNPNVEIESTTLPIPESLPPAEIKDAVPPPVLQPPAEASSHSSPGPAQGLALAAAAFVARDTTIRPFADEVDAVAEQIGQRRSALGWRWWKRPLPCKLSPSKVA
jgi:hypothetical protein